MAWRAISRICLRFVTLLLLRTTLPLFPTSLVVVKVEQGTIVLLLPILVATSAESHVHICGVHGLPAACLLDEALVAKGCLGRLAFLALG